MSVLEMNFHHIGVATNNLDKAIRLYSDLGYNMENTNVVYDPIQKVKIAFMDKDGAPLTELLEPHGENSPVENILKKNGASPYHTCYEVPSLKTSLAEMQALKFIQIIEPTPAVAFNNRLICFFYSKSIGLIELLEAR